ncbi:MAG: hypothetical protein AMJ90_07270 [candidate division Zixibacteria bacterium SM23_73_2]|nr:MAG: hypothetical protein AMJ90_07270 [candidate division Zixibacteria bacterium SM23_73_2]
MNVVLLGIPGSGKGTQADFLKNRLGLRTINTGDLLREAMKKKTELGKRTKEFMEKGDLVPDKILLDFIEEKIKEQKRSSGFVLDGFPRTLKQAEDLDLIFQKLGTELDCAIKLDISEKRARKRLEGRLVCPFCGAFFNLETNPPKDDILCDICGNKLVRRFDDNKETIATRIQVYREKTKPVENYYKKQGKLEIINGDAEADVVSRRIISVLGK